MNSSASEGRLGMGRSATAGEIYDPLYHTPQDDLYDVYRILRDDHPVYFCERRRVWCISRYADCQAAARAWQVFSNDDGVDLDVPARYFGQGDFLDSDPPRHDELRKAVRPFFIPKAIARLEETVTRRVDDVLATIAEASRVDLAQQVAWALPIWVICRLVGVPTSDDQEVHRMVSELVARTPGEVDLPERSVSALSELQAYATELAKVKAANPGEDLMTHMVQLARSSESPLREEDLQGLTVLLFVAGSETTAALLSNALYVLDQHADVQRRLRAEPSRDFLEAVIEEVLRTESPVQYLARQTTEDTTVENVEIPGGADVILLFGAANRDERRFERAERFEPDRVAQRHLAFGEGIHFCLGAPIARLEARVLLPAFFNAFSSYSIDGDAERLQTHMVRGYESLPATVEAA
jgi:cytochrome P450